MFIPYDYQMDYLNALHLFYYAFPPPVKVSYYSINNKQDIADATETTKSYYSHPLDDTSIATYSQIEQLPVYFSSQAEPKVNQATEVGNYLNQQNFTVVIPAIFGLQPEIDDMVVFSSTNVDRLFRVTNLEVVNLFESSPIRAFRIQLEIDKNKPDIITPRLTEFYRFTFDFYKILSTSDYDYLYNNLFTLLQLNLIRLDQNPTANEYINVFLSYLYNKYKGTFDVLINKNNFEKMDILLNYSSYDYSILFDIPFGVQSIPDVDQTTLLKIQTMINTVNQDQKSDQYLIQFNSDYVDHTIQPQYETDVVINLDRIIMLNYAFKEVNKILGISDDL